MSIVLFYLVVYTLSFAIVYKRPSIFKPVYWCFETVGLGAALECMLCIPMYIAAAFSTFTLLLLPELTFSPSLYVFGEPSTWYYLVSYIFIDALSASAVIYLIDKFEVSLDKDNSNIQILND